MNKTLILKIAGAVGVIGGGACLYFAGVSQATAGTVLAGVFTFIGLIMAIFADKAK